jgi:hypothetical protein
VTHKLDIPDRWLMDIEIGEIVILSKAISEVYQLQVEDAVAVRVLIKVRADPEV